MNFFKTLIEILKCILFYMCLLDINLNIQALIFNK